jgi:hypothetical protein
MLREGADTCTALRLVKCGEAEGID